MGVGLMSTPKFIEVEDYINGRWVTRTYPREQLVNLWKQIGQVLGELSPSEQAEQGQEHHQWGIVD